MPDDAMERARQAAADLRLVLGSKGITLTDDARTAINQAFLAFASQQAPEGWMLVPEACSERWLHCAKKLLGADAGEAQIIWSAMLDAAPSVTLGEVG